MTDPSGEAAISCSFSQQTGAGSCSAPTDDGDNKHVNVTTSVTDKSGHTTSATEHYDNAYVARVGSMGAIIGAQFKHDMNTDVHFKGPDVGSQLASMFHNFLAAVGLTVGGVKISGYTQHGVNRAIGDDQGRAGTSPESILDAVRNPTKVVNGVDNQGRPYTIYYGKNARVVLNPTTGKVISVNPLNGTGVR
jgi:hypothetical protein